MPVSVLAAIYRRLVDEGILSSVRGSRTILRGRNSARSLEVRGVIGIALSGPRLRTLRDYRQAFLSLRNELEAYRFLVVPHYSEKRAVEPEDIVHWSKEGRVDLVICLLPDEASGPTALRLGDLGIRFIGVNIGGISDASCRYEVSRREAILEIMNHWRADADLEAATIVLAGNETAAERESIASLRGLVLTEGVPCRITTVPEGRISRFLKLLCAGKTDILLPGPAAAMLELRAADTVTEIFKTCRVALIDGPLDVAFCQAHPQITVDLVTVNWPRIGKRIAHDILSGDAFTQSATTVFEGRAHLHAPLNKSTTSA